ncbi:MAG: HNH endonuclease [Bdellovibrionales bacterium]|nr:HNH endonuclease [Bdellovibrionales bacterium]
MNPYLWIDTILFSNLFYEAMSELFDSKSASYIKKERERARQLKKTRWWKEKLQQGLCHHCGQTFPPEDLTMDHLVPLARGGRTGKNNVVVSCRPCNTKKSYKL